VPGKPYQSVLIPYEDEINLLRHRRPPYSYARIATILQEKHQISVCRETVFKFVKVRTRGRKVYFRVQVYIIFLIRHRRRQIGKIHGHNSSLSRLSSPRKEFLRLLPQAAAQDR
jgi:hypothetical protein